MGHFPYIWINIHVTVNLDKPSMQIYLKQLTKIIQKPRTLSDV